MARRSPDNSKGYIQPGRPTAGELRPKLTPISFKADDEVVAALEMIETSLGPAVRAKRSVAIRRAILAAAVSLATGKN